MKLKKTVYLLSTIIIGVIVVTAGYLLCSNEKYENYYNTNRLLTMNVRRFNKGILKGKNNSIPVLMYHYIRNEKHNSLATSKEKFAKQMKYLHDNGYISITLDEMYKFNTSNYSIPKKSVVITFDDGYKDNYENAYPIIKKYGLKATIFVITDFIDKRDDTITTNQIKEMSQNGIDIESHTTHHYDLKTLSYKEQLKTMTDSKNTLEKILNKPVNYIAYPYGSYNESSIKACKKAGYVMAFRTHENWCNRKNGIYSLNRIYMNGNFSTVNFTKRITNSNYHFIGWRVWEHITKYINL